MGYADYLATSPYGTDFSKQIIETAEFEELKLVFNTFKFNWLNYKLQDRQVKT